MATLTQGLFNDEYAVGYLVPTDGKTFPKRPEENNTGGEGILQAFALLDVDGAPLGVPGNPLETTAVITGDISVAVGAVANNATQSFVAGTTNPLQADQTGSLKVNVTSGTVSITNAVTISNTTFASTSVISEVTVTPTVTSGLAYAAGNVVGGLLTFTNTGSGTIRSITVTSASTQTTNLRLYLFDANPTASTYLDKTAPVTVAADTAKFTVLTTFATPDSGLGTGTYWGADNIGHATAATTLYGVLVCVGTPTFTTSGDLTVNIAVER